MRTNWQVRLGLNSFGEVHAGALFVGSPETGAQKIARVAQITKDGTAVHA